MCSRSSEHDHHTGKFGEAVEKEIIEFVAGDQPAQLTTFCHITLGFRSMRERPTECGTWEVIQGRKACAAPLGFYW